MKFSVVERGGMGITKHWKTLIVDEKNYEVCDVGYKWGRVLREHDPFIQEEAQMENELMAKIMCESLNQFYDSHYIAQPKEQDMEMK